MRTRSWRVAVALLLFSVPAAGQTVISEADALARLSTDSPRVRAIRASVELARADVIAAGRWPNPRVTYNRESVSGVTENMVTVAQALPISGRRDLEVSAASALADARVRRADEEIRRLRADLRSAYADLVSARTRGQAQLEAARAETAALRSLANGAKLLDEHPALARMRLVEALPYGASVKLSLTPDDRGGE